MKWPFVFVVCFLMAYISCGEKKKPLDPKFDESLYEKVDENFFKSKTTGKFFIRTSMILTVKDSGNRLIFYFKEVPDVDTATFERLGYGGFFAKDKKQVYTWELKSDGEEMLILNGADPASFKVIGYQWAKDTAKVYYRNNVMKGLDPAFLQIVCAETEDSSSLFIDYIRDNDQLFYKDKEIKVPTDMDITRLTCVEDLFGNPFVSYNNHLYVVRNERLELYQ